MKKPDTDINLLRAFVALFVSFTEEEFEQLLPYFSIRELRKNEFLLEEGTVCSFVAFVCSGTLIYYRQLDNGNEVTTDFAFVGDWATNNQSRLTGTPSVLNIKAITTARLLVISEDDLQKCYMCIPRVERLGRMLLEQSFVRIAAQTIDLQTLSATERYMKLLNQHPDLLQKVPLHYLANYLGITPKSLSRIRKTIQRYTA